MDLGGVDGVDVVLGRLEAAPLGRRRKVHRIDLSKGSDEIAIHLDLIITFFGRFENDPLTERGP